MWFWILVSFYAGVFFGIIMSALVIAENEDDPYP
jgi:hypothetical protein